MQFNPLTTILDEDLWRYGMFFGVLFCVATIIFSRSKQIGWIACTTWFYVLCSAIATIEYPVIRFGVVNTGFMATAGQTALEVLVIPLAVLSLPRILFNKSIEWMTWLILTDLIAVWIFGTGIMIAPSFDLALIAMFLPFAPIWLVILSGVTILTHHASTAVMIMVAQCMVFAMSYKRLRPIVFAVIPVAIASAFYHARGPNLDGNERVTVWKSMMSHWWRGTSFVTSDNLVSLHFGGTLLSKVTGAGAGSFLWLSLMCEPAHMFMSAHSEIIQITFELGFVGLFLALATTMSAVKRCWDRPGIVAAVMGVVACSMFYHPLRFAPTAILIAFIFREALEKQTANGKTVSRM